MRTTGALFHRICKNEDKLIPMDKCGMRAGIISGKNRLSVIHVLSTGFYRGCYT
jgi:hypothetical protein